MALLYVVNQQRPEILLADALLLDTDKEFLVVALTGRAVTQNSGQTRLDDVLETLEDALGARVAGAEEGVDRLVDAFAGLWCCQFNSPHCWLICKYRLC